jgi:hypothetical protein
MATKAFTAQISTGLQRKADAFFAHIAKKPFVHHREQAFLPGLVLTQLV